MATFNEVQYMIFDELKLGSDDSVFNTDHILFLMKNFRSVLIKQKYTDAKDRNQTGKQRKYYQLYKNRS